MELLEYIRDNFGDFTFTFMLLFMLGIFVFTAFGRIFNSFRPWFGKKRRLEIYLLELEALKLERELDLETKIDRFKPEDLKIQPRRIVRYVTSNVIDRLQIPVLVAAYLLKWLIAILIFFVIVYFIENQLVTGPSKRIVTNVITIAVMGFMLISFFTKRGYLKTYLEELDISRSKFRYWMFVEFMIALFGTLLLTIIFDFFMRTL